MNIKPNILLVGEGALCFNQAIINDHYECNHVFTGDEALEALVENKYTLILSDFRLQDVKGDSLHSSLRTRGDHTPLVFLTDKEDLDAVQNLKICCGGGYMLSPAIDEQFLILLKEAGQRNHEGDCV